MDLMNLQQWALLIVPNTAMLVIVGVVVAAIRQEWRKQDEAKRQRERAFAQHRRML